MNTYVVHKSCLKEKFAEIVEWNYRGYDLMYPYSYVVYVGDIPFRVKSKISEEEFKRICG